MKSTNDMLEKKTKRSSKTEDLSVEQKAQKKAKILAKALNRVEQIKNSESYEKAKTQENKTLEDLKTKMANVKAWIVDDQNDFKKTYKLIIDKILDNLYESAWDAFSEEKIVDMWNKIANNILTKELKDYQNAEQDILGNKNTIYEQYKRVEAMVFGLDDYVIVAMDEIDETPTDEVIRPAIINELISYLSKYLFEPYKKNKKLAMDTLCEYATKDIPDNLPNNYKHSFFTRVLTEVTGKDTSTQSQDELFNNKDVKDAFFAILGPQTDDDAIEKFNKAIATIKGKDTETLKSLIDANNQKPRFRRV